MLNEADLSRVDLNLLVVFEAVLGEGHVGRAAGRLDLSPSAFSHGLGRLRRLLNDPLFLRTPKGVVPTARGGAGRADRRRPGAGAARDLGRHAVRPRPVDPPVRDRRPRRALRRVPARAARRGRPRRAAPGVDVGVRHLHRDTALAELDARGVDVAVVPLDDLPARFAERVLYEEDFVIAARAGHPFAGASSLARYCGSPHLVVSLAGGPRGGAGAGTYVDEALAGLGLARRVALTVPSFMLALAVVGETDLVAALPRRFVAAHAARFGVVGVEAPLPLRRFRIRVIAPKVAMMDAGLAWLFDLLAAAAARAASAGRARGGAGWREGEGEEPATQPHPEHHGGGGDLPSPALTRLRPPVP